MPPTVVESLNLISWTLLALNVAVPVGIIVVVPSDVTQWLALLKLPASLSVGWVASHVASTGSAWATVAGTAAEASAEVASSTARRGARRGADRLVAVCANECEACGVMAALSRCSAISLPVRCARVHPLIRGPFGGFNRQCGLPVSTDRARLIGGPTVEMRARKARG